MTKVEHVVAPWTFFAMGRDGIELEARTTWTFTIRDGAIERVCMCQERREALEAAGLFGVGVSEENVELVRRAFAEFGATRDGVEEGGPLRVGCARH